MRSHAGKWPDMQVVIMDDPHRKARVVDFRASRYQQFRSAGLTEAVQLMLDEQVVSDAQKSLIRAHTAGSSPGKDSGGKA
jgi:hypothetical protein